MSAPRRARSVWAVLAIVGLVLGCAAVSFQLQLRSFLHEVELDPARPVHDGDADAAFWFGHAAILVVAAAGGLCSLLGLTGTSRPAWRRWIRAVALVGLALAAATVVLMVMPYEWGLA